MSINSLILEPTKKTPWIVLEPGKVVFVGRSILENPAEFYRPVHEWVSMYAAESSKMTTIQFGFEFINTTSIKWVYAILKELAKIPDMPDRAKISWIYEEGDEDMCDLGFILRSLVDCPFAIIEVEDIYKHKLE
ncbi:MAG: hypothetical protein C0408_02885 [Odoribacter sp.]|nr:hypothetical protein [Odoribacter sp.]